MNDLIQASLVYDGGDTVIIPPELGTPRADQMQGTPAERLVELAGRSCYDSLGKGRPSFSIVPPAGSADTVLAVQGYHDHIKEVNHGSVLEHFAFTVYMVWHGFPRWMTFVNRPGLWVNPYFSESGVRFTANLRTVREWDNWTAELVEAYQVDPWFVKEFDRLGDALKSCAHSLAPHIITDNPPHGRDKFELTAPVNDHEKWISMFMSGSRGLSHELVRHGDFTAISQRSTRFVDESESAWVEHPLRTEFRGRYPDHTMFHEKDIGCDDAQRHARATYKRQVSVLEAWLIERGVDKAAARKQARGAARGDLGNALGTELIFSANIAQWKRMLRQRASRHADAEIRELFCKALLALKQSRYADRFTGFELEPSPDGIGQNAVEKKCP